MTAKCSKGSKSVTMEVMYYYHLPQWHLMTPARNQKRQLGVPRLHPTYPFHISPSLFGAPISSSTFPPLVSPCSLATHSVGSLYPLTSIACYATYSYCFLYWCQRCPEHKVPSRPYSLQPFRLLYGRLISTHGKLQRQVARR